MVARASVIFFPLLGRYRPRFTGIVPNQLLKFQTLPIIIYDAPLSSSLERANGDSRFRTPRQLQFHGETPLSSTVPQAILDRLTYVAMPRLVNERPSKELMTVGGYVLPVHRAEVLVLGSGAVGYAPQSSTKRRDVDVLVASQSAFGGTSACSGSDKQTLHTANTAGRGDDFRALAEALGAGGAMDEDTAYVEAVGSSRALASLQFMGLPLPQDRLGGVLRCTRPTMTRSSAGDEVAVRELLVSWSRS